MHLSTCLRRLRIAAFASALAAIPLSTAGAAPARAPIVAPTSSDQVSCLIPGEIKRLDNHTSYLSARRVIRTTREECRNRGGEIDGQARNTRSKRKSGIEPEAIKDDPPPGAGY